MINIYSELDHLSYNDKRNVLKSAKNEISIRYGKQFGYSYLLFTLCLSLYTSMYCREEIQSYIIIYVLFGLIYYCIFKIICVLLCKKQIKYLKQNGKI